MAENSKIEWTDLTAIVDRNGRRTRYYLRKRADRPGTQLRRQMREKGLSWCRGCRVWLPAEQVHRVGACRECLNAEARKHYAIDHAFRERRQGRWSARRRGVGLMPTDVKDAVAELFDHACAYCAGPLEAWDHFVPITKGGTTTAGNMVPSCRRCNSKKRNRDPLEFISSLPEPSLFLLEYTTVLGAI